MRAKWIRIGSLVGVLAALSAGALVHAGDRRGACDATEANGSAGAASGVLRAYRDPSTGELVAPPTGALPEAAGPAGLAPGAPLAPLRQRRSPVAGGGVIVDLGGRFQATMRAERDGEGRLVATCTTEGVQSGAQGTRER